MAVQGALLLFGAAVLCIWGCCAGRPWFWLPSAPLEGRAVVCVCADNYASTGSGSEEVQGCNCHTCPSQGFIRWAAAVQGDTGLSQGLHRDAVNKLKSS